VSTLALFYGLAASATCTTWQITTSNGSKTCKAQNCKDYLLHFYLFI